MNLQSKLKILSFVDKKIDVSILVKELFNSSASKGSWRFVEGFLNLSVQLPVVLSFFLLTRG